MIGGLFRTFQLGMRSLLLHGLRSLLTCMGVLFGVASVIAMLAIGEGLSADVQARIQALGSNNILVRSVKPPENQNASAERARISSYGLTYADAERLQKTLPQAEVVVPVRAIYQDIRFYKYRSEGRIVGTIPWFTRTNQYRVKKGRFLSSVDLRSHRRVCVLGSTIARELFPLEEPIGKLVKLGKYGFRCVGIMEPRTVIRGDDSGALEDFGHDVYAPLTTIRETFGETIVKISSGSRSMEQVELHQLQVRVEALEEVEAAARIVKEMMEYAHNDKDYDVIVPLSLLREAEVLIASSPRRLSADWPSSSSWDGRRPGGSGGRRTPPACRSPYPLAYS